MKKFITISLGLILIFTSCKVNFIPVYNPIAKLQVEQLFQSSKTFYEDMKKDSDHVVNYSEYEDGYISLLAQMHNIRSLDSARPKSAIIRKMASDIERIFSKYREIHKSRGTLNDSQIDIQSKYMKGLIKNLYNSEINFKDQ